MPLPCPTFAPPHVERQPVVPIVLIAAAGEQLTEKERVEFKRLTGREREPGKLVKEFVCRQWCGRKPLLPVVRDAGALSRFDRDDHRRNNRDARQHVGLQLGLDVGHLAVAPCL